MRKGLTKAELEQTNNRLSRLLEVANREKALLEQLPVLTGANIVTVFVAVEKLAEALATTVQAVSSAYGRSGTPRS